MKSVIDVSNTILKKLQLTVKTEPREKSVSSSEIDIEEGHDYYLLCYFGLQETRLDREIDISQNIYVTQLLVRELFRFFRKHFRMPL